MTSEWGALSQARQKLKGRWVVTLTVGDSKAYQGTAVVESELNNTELLKRAQQDVGAQLMGRLAPALAKLEKEKNEPKEKYVDVMKESFTWKTCVVDEEQLKTKVAVWRKVMAQGHGLWLCIDTEGCVKVPQSDTRGARVLVLGVGHEAVLAVANEASWEVLLPLLQDPRCNIVMHDAKADKARLSFLVQGGRELNNAVCTQKMNQSLQVSRHDGLVPLAGELLCENRALTDKHEGGQRWYDAFDQVVLGWSAEIVGQF